MTRFAAICRASIVAASLAVMLVSAPLVAGEIVVEKEITYCTAGGVDLKLDVARPKDGDGPFPAIVFIHGGGWKGGNRNAYSRYIELAAQRGYVAVTITYRLTDPDAAGKAKHPFPAQIHDAKSAVRWLRANAKTYRADPDRIGVTGGSAGGHLSLLVGLTDVSAKLEGDDCHTGQSSRVQAVVNVFGPTEMVAEYGANDFTAGLVKTLLGGTPEESADAYKQASPVTYASEDDPPVLTLHGTADVLVPVAQARLLDAAMREKGATHELIIFEGEGHGFKGKAAEEANTALWQFFDKHLKN